MKQSKLGIKLLACALALSLLLTACAESFRAVVFTDVMNVYSRNQAEEKYRIDTLSRGEKFIVTAKSNGWCKIEYGDGKGGYVQVENLRSMDTYTLAYTTDRTRVYTEASTDSKQIGTIAAGYELFLVGQKGSFYLVEDPGTGNIGYILKTALTKDAPAPQPTAPTTGKISYKSSSSTTDMPSSVRSQQSKLPASANAQERIEYMIYICQNRLGCPYELSGDLVNTFNNISFVTTAFEAVGMRIPGSASGIAEGKGMTKLDAISGLKRGDIVYFDNDEDDKHSVDHVGIYLGDDWFIHSSQAAGCAIVTKMNTDYYQRTFRGGVRVF